MEQDSPNSPSKFRKLPLYLGRAAFFLATVPIAMIVLCIITQNTVSSLIDFYYFFVTPIQVCKWSLVASLIMSFAVIISAGTIYRSNFQLYQIEYVKATSYFLLSMILIIMEISGVYTLTILAKHLH